MLSDISISVNIREMYFCCGVTVCCSTHSRDGRVYRQIRKGENKDNNLKKQNFVLFGSNRGDFELQHCLMFVGGSYSMALALPFTSTEVSKHRSTAV